MYTYFYMYTVPPRNNLSKTASEMRPTRVCGRPQTRPSCVSPASDPRPARVCGRPQTRLPAGTISFCCLRTSGRRKHITSEFFGNIQPALSLSQSVPTYSYCSKLSQYTRNRIISPRESNNSIVNIFRILQVLICI